MHRLLMFAGAIALVGCAGSTSFVDPCPDGGYSRECGSTGIDPQLTLTPGGTGQVPLYLLVEGSHVGTFDFAAEPQDTGRLTASVAPTSAEVKDGVVRQVVVTVSALPDAGATMYTSVYVTGRPRGGSEKDGAGTSIGVKIVTP